MMFFKYLKASTSMFVNAEYGGNSIDAEETLLPIDVL